MVIYDLVVNIIAKTAVVVCHVEYPADDKNSLVYMRVKPAPWLFTEGGEETPAGGRISNGYENRWDSPKPVWCNDISCNTL